MRRAELAPTYSRNCQHQKRDQTQQRYGQSAETPPRDQSRTAAAPLRSRDSGPQPAWSLRVGHPLWWLDRPRGFPLLEFARSFLIITTYFAKDPVCADA